MAAIALAPAAVFALIVGETMAENECGPHESGREIICSPTNYDSADKGNIFYSPKASSGNFRIKLIDGLVIGYDRDDPDDDVPASPSEPEIPLHSAVSIIPAETGYSGDISITSSADITSNAKGITAVHPGGSGALRAELTGGSITTGGDRAAGVELFHEGAGDIGIKARDLAILTNGSVADGIGATHKGEGEIGIDVRDVTITTLDRNADGVYALHEGAEGDSQINILDSLIMTMGDEAEGILMIQEGAGEIEILVRDTLIQTEGDGAEGIHGLHRDEGDVNIEVWNTEVFDDGLWSIRGSRLPWRGRRYRYRSERRDRLDRGQERRRRLWFPCRFSGRYPHRCSGRRRNDKG